MQIASLKVLTQRRLGHIPFQSKLLHCRYKQWIIDTILNTSNLAVKYLIKELHAWKIIL